jgi:hypothetical protein
MISKIKYFKRLPFKIYNEIVKQISKNKIHNEYSDCLFFSSRSVLSLVNILFPIKEYPKNNKKYDNNLFFIKSSKINNLIKIKNKKFNKNFILISGDSDYSISLKYYNKSLLIKILQKKKLLKWFTQNLDYKHKKLEYLPHGVDYHTIWEKRKNWVKKRLRPKIQEKKLLTISKMSKKNDQRINKIFHNWHFSLDHGKRHDYFKYLKNKKENFFLNNKLNKFENFKKQIKFKYIFCPQGKGMDDPRVYESIILGNIIIRMEDNLKYFFRDLPVIHLRKIEDLNLNNLNNLSKNFNHRKFNFAKLLNLYWFDKLNIKKNNYYKEFKNLRFDDFKNKLKIL